MRPDHHDDSPQSVWPDSGFGQARRSGGVAAGDVRVVTVEQAQLMAQKYILPDKTIVLAVGDRAKIEEDMKKLNLGKVEIRDTEGKISQ